MHIRTAKKHRAAIEARKRYSSVRAVKTKRREIIRCLTKLEFSRVKGVGSTSKGLLNRVKSFEFTVTLIFWEKILTKTQAVSNLLQLPADQKYQC